jgi:Tol biopolymer transport system component
MMPLDASAPPRQITSFPNDALAHSSLSPDGRRVAFASIAAGSSDIWIQDVDGSNLRQLTNDDAADAWPVWSPDGESLVFNSLRDGRHQTWRASAADGSAQKIVDGFFRGDWVDQPDGSGTWIVTSMGPGGVRLIDVEQRSVVWEVLRPDALAMPMFSPDRRSISVPLTRGRAQTDIAVLDAATGSIRIAAHLSFPVLFRACWIDGGRAVLVNRDNSTSHVVMFDRFPARDGSKRD